jgi:uncharacterized circularly permuted ATP-grasp superfamily protein/uncharacterized alpha-E superfamily protein
MSATTGAFTGESRPFADLLSHYRSGAGVYDALLGDRGEVRPEWTSMLAALAGSSDAERTRLNDSAQRILRENGVTFVAQDDAESTSRPWRLDLIPTLIPEHDWQVLEAGLTQRAQLLNTVLGDLYGEQRSIKESVLPPTLVFGNSRFLPACTNLPIRGDTHLHLIAFDVARAPDGGWWVLSNRTEVPSGAGYALENRVVTSRCLPELFDSHNVRRHANFFRAFNEYFLSLAEKDEPLAVFLSRGPTKLTYFDHAYLARYLGHNIVEGSDLTVRDDRVYLKTIEGLRQVDLIFRTVRSEMCDPLELRPDSMIGVPGLLQAARAGTVTIGNRLGSGLIESAGFVGFMPSLCRFFLGEELSLPSVATWWCGQQKEQRYVLDHLDDLLIRRISTTRSVLVGDQDGRIGQYLTNVSRDELVDMIKGSGYDFVGQEPLKLSTAPVWAGHELQSAPSVLRIYVAATENGYEVLPGGLTRISHDSDPQASWLAASDVSKDTWVLADEPVEPFSLLAQRQQEGRLRRGHRNLPSRAADHLFWLGRYAERAEAAVRLFRSLVIRLSGEIGAARHLVSHERIVSLLVMQKHMSARRGKRAMQTGREAVEQELWAILFDPESRDGLANVIGNVRRTAEVVRERLSFDAYRILTDLADAVKDRSASGGRETERALRLLNRLVQRLAAFSGMAMENMTRGYGWEFLDMGRRIERIRALNHLVQHLTVHGDPDSDGGLELLLELADSTMTYRGRYHTAPQLARVLDLVLADESNPRSLGFQVEAIRMHLMTLPHDEDVGLLTEEQRITTQLSGALRLADVYKLSGTKNRFDARVQLDRLTRDIEQATTMLSDHISRRYFSHSLARRVSGTGQPE